jgi:hypothetical protein
MQVQAPSRLFFQAGLCSAVFFVLGVTLLALPFLPPAIWRGDNGADLGASRISPDSIGVNRMVTIDSALSSNHSFQIHYAHGLRPVAMGQVTGYQNRTGEWHIAPRFSAALPFSEGEGLAAVKIGDGDEGVWGFIDTTGQWRITPTFARVLHGFAEGKAVVVLPGLIESPVAFIDTSGGMLFDWVFSDALPFKGGHAQVFCGPEGYVGRPHAWGLIDSAGLWVRPCQQGLHFDALSAADFH